ncbi:hypothetical protein [Sediminitomix flava]|uniref:LPP20 lipoprotein n=1 Tax=Sediminitomix flava TaxID=379075 RepID=A0A315Z8H3_SEDFL|nr:hypothetical protein [Sediminitomix flava]PWJ41865.1 hypothetical protein BC781_103115 [Sediminitomix flava]
MRTNKQFNIRTFLLLALFIPFSFNVSFGHSDTQGKSPFRSNNYNSDNAFLRATGFGQKAILSASIGAADKDAKTQLQGLLTQKMNSINNSFFQIANSTEQEKAILNKLGKSIIKNIETQLIDRVEYYTDKDGYYKSWRAHQISKGEIIKKVNNSLILKSIDQQLKIKYISYLESNI